MYLLCFRLVAEGSRTTTGCGEGEVVYFQVYSPASTPLFCHHSCVFARNWTASLFLPPPLSAFPPTASPTTHPRASGINPTQRLNNSLHRALLFAFTRDRVYSTVKFYRSLGKKFSCRFLFFFLSFALRFYSRRRICL